MSFNTPRGHSFVASIADPARLHGQLERLAAQAKGRRLDHLSQEGVRFLQLSVERDELVALLRRALLDGSYRASVARASRVVIGNKTREIARLGAIDAIAHGSVAEVLASLLEDRLSPRVYSYRRKRSPWQALRWLGRIASAHAARRPDPRTRGLYVLRGDIHNCGSSIPLDDASPLWSELEELSGLKRDSPHGEMLRALVLQPLESTEGAALSRKVGLLFGAPTSNVLVNMFLMPIDDSLGQLRGAYARYGDDVLFAHADPEVVREAKVLLERVVVSRGLTVNPNKLQIFYWNGAARPSPLWSETTPTSSIRFVGAEVSFDGTIGLSREKWTHTLRDLRARLRRTVRLLPEADAKSRARVLARVANAAFDPRSDVGLRHRQMIAELVSDRRQLAQLDYWVARWIAEIATGGYTVRAFRQIPYRWLREEAGLVSRVVTRNG